MQKNWLSETKRQLHAGQLQAAYQSALERLADNRSDADAWGIMSLVALEGENLSRSLELSDKALELGAKDVGLLAGRGRVLLATGRQNEARDLARSVTLPDCENALDADTIGVILARTGLHEEAVPYFYFATANDQAQAQFQYNLATSLQFIGDLEKAKQVYKKVLDIDPNFHRARLALVQLEPQTDKGLMQIEALFEQNQSDADSALQLGHAAAKIFEERGDHAKSLEWLLKAKAGKRKKVDHKQDWVTSLFGAVQARDPMPISQAADNRQVPVFIVGMPRSGTTLIERILSSHSAVASAGELPDLALLIKRSGDTAGAHTLSPESLAAAYDPKQVGQAYLERTQELTGGKEYLIDKMPFNYFFVGHILESLPAAKVIMVRRDPRDTVFANFRQLFATDFGYYNYAYDLNDTIQFVRLFSKLADHWDVVLPPDRYYEVRYEDMIVNQEDESRRLIKFLGLEWEGQCLQFHKNRGPVATASSVQVRSPIHSRSVGQWRRYGQTGEYVDDVFRN